MIKVTETLNGSSVSLKGNMPDILAYLEKEQERCGKISIPQYIRLRKTERVVSKQVGTHDLRGYENAKQ